MAKRSTGNTELLQVKISPELKGMLERMAERRQTTVSEVARQELWHAALRDALAAPTVEQVA